MPPRADVWRADKQLAQLVGELVDSDPSKRPSALKALEHAYFADQYTTLDALKDSSKNLRAARNALAALGTQPVAGRRVVHWRGAL